MREVSLAGLGTKVQLQWDNANTVGLLQMQEQAIGPLQS